MRRVLLAAALVLVGLTAACGSDQDPGLDSPATVVGQTTAPPQLLTDCPPGGPNASTPAAGCVDSKGNVRHYGE